MPKKIAVIFGILLCLFFHNFVCANQETKYPDYSNLFVGDDKWENFNRKIFDFNLKLNKYAIRPIHILWSSIMPEYGMDRIQSMTYNIEYPIRLVSSLLQKDFEASKTETIRFFTNTIIGLGGMFDPAKSLFNIEPVKEDMEQALAGCKMKAGPYVVLPVISSTTIRGILGKILDMALNPGSYIATPVLAIVKAGLTVNKTSYYQPLIKMVESTYADPYEIAKKAYGIDMYMKCTNLDRIDVLPLLIPKEEDKVKENTVIKKAPVVEVKKKVSEDDKNLVKKEVSSVIVMPGLLRGGTNIDDVLEQYSTEDFRLDSDILLPGYHPQNPVVDSMRTALFQTPGVDKSVWNELSIWNRSFAKRIKTSSVNIVEGREDYDFRYLMQKDKTSPVVIIYPSIGEGIMSSHSVSLAKLFYDEGYSVVILGSHFQWEFIKSLPEFYKPGLPAQDAEAVRIVTLKVLDFLQDKYECKFSDKTIIGTSFGALTALFVADKESRNNTLGNTKYISICPPIELIYAMKQVDKLSQDWNHSPDDFKRKTAETAAKVLKLYESKDELSIDDFILPFTEEEGKLITGFIMHQKLSDLIFTIENTPTSERSDIYHQINNMGYQEYTQKYLLSDANETCEDLSYEVSLHSISDFLETADNYKIYHSLNDYLTNSNQLKKLKQYSGNKLVLIDNGAHLGFLYRKEFIENLKHTISLHKDTEHKDKESVNKASLSSVCP